MKRLVTILLLIFLLVIVFNPSTQAQIYNPQGLNMPGGWNGWTNPPTNVLALASATQVTGGKVAVITTGTRRYHTKIKVAASGGDVVGGTYAWLFTSGPSDGVWNNKWGSVTVSMNTLQTYTKEGSDNSITVTNDKWYTVNWKDIGYVNTDAIFMETSGEPVTIASVSHSPLSINPSDIITITANINAVNSAEEILYVRWTTDNWVSSNLALLSFSGTVGTTQIGPFAGGTAVSYYVFSTTVANPVANFDLYSIDINNNGGSNYSFSVLSPNYTIAASAGLNGAILPSGDVIVPHGGSQTFTITPDVDYSVDSVIVNSVNTDSTTSYTFNIVTANHTIRAVFARKVDVTFGVNMKPMMRNGDFIPDSGDVVAVRGNFNNWKNKNLLATIPDTLWDIDNDSIYTKTIAINENQVLDYKFWKTLRNGLEWENDPNRSLSLGVNDTILPVIFFNNANVSLTFSVDMKIQMRTGSFMPVLGDILTVRGTVNNWNNSTQFFDLDGDSIYTNVLTVEGSKTHYYKYWKTYRSGVDWETISDRAVNLGSNDTALSVVYFNNIYPSVNITFQLDMRVKMKEKTFLPEAGDFVTVRGSFNNWGDEPVGNLDTLIDLDGDSVYTRTIPISGNQTIGYKFWKSPRGGIDFETIPNRGFNVQLVDDIIPTVYFDDDATVDMGIFIVANGWNMVSVPVNATDYSKTALFPTAQTSAFTFNSGYTAKETLENGVGYWIKFDGEQSINIIGGSIVLDTIVVSTGWNMIGSISTPVDVGLIVQDPPGIVSSKYYGYSAGYQIAETLYPGKGYWVKANAPGQLIFDVSGFKK